MAKSQTYYHTIDAKIATNIGEDSISDPIQAVLELAKNSLDADSLELLVNFVGQPVTGDPDTYHIDKIVITDKGIAMHDKDISGKYFRIGTDNKMRDTESPILKRRVVGEKGQGHYAAKRLGNKCVITSNPLEYPGRDFDPSIDKTIIATIDWNKFVPGGNFTEIPSYANIQERTQPDCFCKLRNGRHPHHGLKIELSDLKEPIWTRLELDRVKIALSGLRVPALLAEGRDRFDIKMIVPGGDPEDAYIDTTILNQALFKLTAEITGTKEGKQSITYRITKYNERAEHQTSEIVPTTELAVSGTSGDMLQCGDVTLDVYHFPQDTKGLGKEQFEIAGLQKNAIANFLRGTGKDQSKGYAGIKIYNDDPRLMPFGQIGHALYDWAGLDIRFLQKTQDRIRQHAVVGFLRLTRDTNKDIEEVATRQGIKENAAFRDLVLFVQAAYEQLEIEEAKLKPKTANPQTFLANKIQTGIDTVEKTLANLHHIEPRHADDMSLIKDQIKTLKHDVKISRKEDASEKEQLVGENEMLSAAATVGISTLSFGHEIGQKLNTISSALKTLRGKENLTPDQTSSVETMHNLMDDVLSWIAYLQIFAGALSSTNQRDARLKHEKIDLRKMLNGDTEEGYQTKITGLIESFRNRATVPGTEQKIHIATPGISGTSTAIVHANKALIISIFSNLIENSLKSIKYKITTKKINLPNPEVKIEIWKEGGFLNISCWDNGYGIPEAEKDKIWRPFWSKYKYDSRYRGMGLGTVITKKITERTYHGMIKLEDTKCDADSPGQGFAKFLIQIPLKQLDEPKMKGKIKTQPEPEIEHDTKC